MTTLAAQITDAGAIGPSYADILQQLRIVYWGIYGSDALLDDDTQDGQFLAAAIAQPAFDASQAVIDAYAGFAPSTARGAQLSAVVKINGLRRAEATNSQTPVVVSGTVGTIINDGIIGDSVGLGTRWALPPVVTIGLDGTTTETATCTDPGDFVAGHDTLTVILTPTLGWQSVTNGTNDTAPGQPVETDAHLRARQTVSVALPAQAILDSIEASVAAVEGVTRLMVYENDTDTTNADGIPSHSVSVVVSGGDVDAVAQAIALKKPPGTGTYGTTVKIVPDSRGVPRTIKFYELADVPLTMIITIHPLTGYVSTTGDAMLQAVADFVNGLDIGEDSYTTRLYSPANMGGVGLGATFVVTNVQQSRSGPPGTANVVIAFNEGATLDVSNITLVLV
jgi:uncharacterized phage protein gp47/JayE